MQWDAARAVEEIQAEGLRRVERAAIHLAGATRQTLSVPAPRRRVVSARGVAYYRATTPATPGAPPRKLSGRLRTSTTWAPLPDGTGCRVGTNLVHGRPLETWLNHPFLSVTFQQELPALQRLMGA